MNARTSFPWITFTLLISFASVNAVLYTPALPDMTAFLQISHAKGEATVLWYLIGYALGQLLYGPLAARFGRKIALYMGIGLQIIASLGCAATLFHLNIEVLLCSRFLVALGAGVGLKMTFTLVNEWYEPKIAAQKIAYLMLAFAITPGLAVSLGGVLNTHYGWASCFYAGACLGFILLFLVHRLPLQATPIDYKAMHLSHLKQAYSQQFTNSKLVLGGLLMGAAGCFVYVFAAIAPFISMELMHVSSTEYGALNLIPALGMIGGSICSGIWVKKYPLKHLIKIGVLASVLGVVMMLVSIQSGYSPIFSLFLPMSVIYFGLSLVVANASTFAMSQVSDKSHGSAVMNFINMGTITFTVLILGLFPINAMLLPIVFVLACLMMSMIMTRL